MSKSKQSIPKACPCDSGKAYKQCCHPLHEGSPAANAEQLMRSRYTAYVLMLEEYLLQTWHPDTRPATLDLQENTSTKWLGLTIKRFEEKSEKSAIVEFVARYKVGGSKAERLHEISQFEQLDRWYYVSGVINE